MDFNKILDTVTPNDKDNFTIQALKRQEYNRKYQAKIRERGRLLTLEKKIDSNLDFVISYIKRKYASEYANYVKPEVKPVKVVDPAGQAFSNWELLSAQEYRSAEDAFEVSGLSAVMGFEDFKRRFEGHYRANDSGRFVRY